MKKNWTFLESKDTYQDNILKVHRDKYLYEPVNETMDFTVVDISNWVVIIPVTKDNKFITVSQFRAGLKTDTLEFPGGAINHNEDPKISALRELEEETGALCSHIELLGIIDPNPAFLSNKCYIYKASNCEIKKEQKLDKFEDAAPVVIDQEDIKCMLKNGEFTQSMSIAAYGLYLNSKE